jgi:hypothetical protein
MAEKHPQYHGGTPVEHEVGIGRIIGEASKHLNEAYPFIRKMVLETNIAELKAFGFTII